MAGKSTKVAVEPSVTTSFKRRRRTQLGNSQQERLIAVAAQMFHDQGYDATSLQEIAETLGLLKGSLYNYIGSKDDLLWEVILRQHRATMALVESCRAMDGTPTERLRAFACGYAPSLKNDRISVAVYQRELVRLSEARRQTILTEREDYVTFLRDLLEDGIASGDFRADLNAELACQGILGMLNSTYRWYRPRRDLTPEQAVDGLLDLVLQGVQA